MNTHNTSALTKKIAILCLCIINIGLLVIQIDALRANQPRFTIRTGDYIKQNTMLTDWKNSGILPKQSEISDSQGMQYNYATMLAQQGEQVGFPDAVEPWKQAIALYEGIDDKEIKDYAEHNKNILQKLIDESVFADPENSPEQQQGQESSPPQEPQAGEQEAEERGDAGDEESQSGEENEGESGSQGEPSNEPQESGLSEEQIQQVQEYQEQLEQQQFQNQKHFGKQPQDQPQSVFQQFFGQPQFQQNANNTEKDR